MLPYNELTPEIIALRLSWVQSYQEITAFMHTQAIKAFDAGRLGEAAFYQSRRRTDALRGFKARGLLYSGFDGQEQ